MNNLSHLNRVMNWAPTAIQVTAASSRHIMSLCLLSRGLLYQSPAFLVSETVYCQPGRPIRKELAEEGFCEDFSREVRSGE